METLDTSYIVATRARLRLVLTGHLGEAAARQTIRELAAPNPPLFFEIGISELALLPDSPERKRAHVRLFECQTFLMELIRIGRYTDQELEQVCIAWIGIDGMLDVRLARLLPGRDEGGPPLSPALAVRVLEVLHRISVGPRLILLVNHLKDHPNRLIAEKATLLVGRRIRNLGWLKQRFASTDSGIRAATVEALWGTDTPSVRQLLRQSLADEDGRVVANALLGLHSLGDPSVRQLVKDMVRDERPSFRSNAISAMAQMGEPEFAETLRAALADSESEVKLGAKKALAALRRRVEEQPEVASELKVAATEPATLTDVQPAPPDEAAEAEATPFRFRFDGSFRTEAPPAGHEE